MFPITESAIVLHLTFAFVCRSFLIKRYHTDNILFNETAANLNKYVQNFIVGDFSPSEHASGESANVRIRFR